jgi:Site-specific recombinase XerD
MEYKFDEAVKGFRSWLVVLNYSQANVYYSPRRAEEFLIYAHQNGKRKLEEVNAETVRQFFKRLEQRRNQRREGALSLNTLRVYRTALTLLSTYLRQTGQPFFEVPVQLKSPELSRKSILTAREIKRLYDVTGDDLLGQRDRAMLAVYYGCGLRKAEGVHLQVRDILSEQNMLYVRKGKGYKERYVPMAGKVKADIEQYLRSGRIALLNQSKDHGYFFVSFYEGKRATGAALYERICTLFRIAQIHKPAGLHTLRHSIATHLLQSGMKLEQIAKFLGHTTLESTQIYTHIVHEQEV